MTFSAYNTSVPATNNNPSVDQPQMLINTQSINTLIGGDHHTFNDNLGGYHTNIHQDQITGNADPANIANINQFYVKTVTPNATVNTPDTQLFAETGTGVISQLTGYATRAYTQGGVSFRDGYQWIGGILLQWGFTFVGSTGVVSNTVTFKDRHTGMIPFPTRCISVQATPINNSPAGFSSSSRATVSIEMDNISATQFSFTFIGNDTTFTGFTWWAIGN